MTTSIQTPDGEFTMLLGYEVIRFLAKPVEAESNELDQIENAALIGFNVWSKRNNLPLVTKDQMVTWFDDMDIYTKIINEVKSFMENFSQRVSGETETSKSKAKK